MHPSPENALSDRKQSLSVEVRIDGAPEPCDAIIINPGAYTQYSIAIRDAIQAVAIPAIEVHLSNLYAREEFRQKSVVTPVCRGHIVGLGYRSYLLAIDAVLALGEED